MNAATCNTEVPEPVRPPAVAGMFYPAEATVLARTVGALLDATTPAPGDMPGILPQAAPKAIVVPHAGYIYSGAIAASAYALLRPVAHRLRRVVLLGPTHRVGIHGLALPAAAAFATPLGSVAVDRDGAAALAGLAQVTIAGAPHAEEHSLEVQLPFLQALLPDFRVLPLAVGRASADEVAAVLDRVWGGDETLIVVSSDLSHYLPYAVAQDVDRTTVARVLAGDHAISHEEACGATPLNGLLLAAQRHGLVARLVDLRNSGDTAGDRSRVVGYGAFAFYAQEDGHGR